MGSNSSSHYGTGGTQVSGGHPISYTTAAGSFGVGGTSITTDGGSGGGAGWYGGGGSSTCSGGGGGSSYISGHLGCIGITEELVAKSQTATTIEDSYSWTGYKFTSTKVIDGQGYDWTTTQATEVTGQPTYDGTSTQIGNEGNGYAKITTLSSSTETLIQQ